jgi:hypothetical protein
MAGGINRPVLPTTGATPDEQRLRTGLGAIVRSVLDSGAFLSRLFPGKTQSVVVGTGTQVQLAWGDMNRLPPTDVVVAFLPQVTRKQIGVPLTISKAYATGVAMVQPAGVGLDGRTQPTVDGLPTGFQMSEAGQRTLMTDGTNWFSQRGGSGGGAGAAVSTPSGVFPPASTWRLPSTYSPIGLWYFDENITSSASPVLPALTVATGAMRYAPIFPGVNAGILGGATGAYLEMPATGTATLFHLRSDISVQWLMWQSDKLIVAPNNSSPLACFAGVGVSAGSENVQWGLYLADNQRADWFTESGDPSTGFSHTVSQPVLPWNNVRPVLYGARRSGNTVQHFLDGKPLGSSASGATPTLGTNGRLFLGGATGDTPAPQMLVSSVKITPNAMSDAEFLADYNATLGQYYGPRY